MRSLLSYSHCKNFTGLQVQVFPLKAQAQKRRQAAGKALCQSLTPQRRKEVINRPKATCSQVCIQVMVPSLCHTCLGRTAKEVCPSPTCWQVHVCTGPKLWYWSCALVLKCRKSESFAPANFSWTNSSPELSTILLLHALKHKLSDSLTFGLKLSWAFLINQAQSSPATRQPLWGQDVKSQGHKSPRTVRLTEI